MPLSHAVIVYSSPAGATRRIAHAMRDQCPEEALRADLSVVEERIRERARTFDEQPLSQVFYVSDEANV